MKGEMTRTELGRTLEPGTKLPSWSSRGEPCPGEMKNPGVEGGAVPAKGSEPLAVLRELFPPRLAGDGGRRRPSSS